MRVRLRLHVYWSQTDIEQVTLTSVGNRIGASGLLRLYLPTYLVSVVSLQYVIQGFDIGSILIRGLRLKMMILFRKNVAAPRNIYALSSWLSAARDLGRHQNCHCRSGRHARTERASVQSIFRTNQIFAAVQFPLLRLNVAMSCPRYNDPNGPPD